MRACLRHSGSPPLPPVHPPTSPLWLVHLSCGAPGPACLVLPLPPPRSDRAARCAPEGAPPLRLLSPPLKGRGVDGEGGGGSAMHSCISSSQTQPLGFLYPSVPAACETFKVRRGVLSCFVVGIIPFRATRWQRAWRPFARCARVMLERRPLCKPGCDQPSSRCGNLAVLPFRAASTSRFTHGEENRGWCHKISRRYVARV